MFGVLKNLWPDLQNFLFLITQEKNDFPSMGWRYFLIYEMIEM